MNLSKYNIKWWEAFWALMLGLFIIAILTWITIGISRAANAPQLSGLDKARNAFIDNCSGTTTTGWFDSKRLVPNTAGDDASKWKCEAK